MKKLVFAVVIALALLATTIPAVTHAEQGSLDGQNFIFVNYIGQEMFFDLDDQTYTIPGTDAIPEGGQLVLTLPAGEHKYAANVPGVGGSAGEFLIEPGVVFARAARIEQTNPVVEDGILIEKPQDYVYVFDFDPFATAEPVEVVDNWLPSVAAPDQGSLVWINYTPDELTVDLNGTLYAVAPPQGDIPGRLQIDVAPGEYAYTASIPYGSINGKISAVGGQVVGLNVTADLPPEPEYEVGEEYDPHQTITLNLFEEELTTQVTTAALPDTSTEETSPQTLPETGGVPAPILPDAPVMGEGLLVKNYVGDTLVFTINNQTFTIAPNAEQIIDLPPGSYSYTASTPFAAISEIVDLGVGQGAELSVVTNINHNELTVFE